MTPTSVPTWPHSDPLRSRSCAGSWKVPADRTEILQALTARPASADFATLIAMADTDEVVRLRLLRAIRDLGV
jgi:hypothetical protein